MSAVTNFFKTFCSDVKIVLNGDDFFEEPKQDRLASIFSRAIGMASIAIAVDCAILGLCMLPAAPLLTVIMGVVAVAALIFAHEAIVIGNNFHKNAELYSCDIPQGFCGFASVLGQKGIGMWHAYSREVRAVRKHSWKELEGTWIAGPVCSILKLNKSKI